jgi:transcriptional regulator with XRE-family HTH domain
MAFDFSDLPLTPGEARAARNYLGLSQKQAAVASNLLLHKIKQYEAGNHIPDTKFLEALKAFYQDKGYDFSDTPAPGDKKKADGTVFPAGVVGAPDDTPPGKVSKTEVQHVRIDPSIDPAQVDNMLEHIDRNEELIAQLLDEKVEAGAFDPLSDKSEAVHGHISRLLAENGTLFSTLFGRPLIEAPAPALVNGTQKPKTHHDLVAKLQAPMHGAIAGDKEALAQVKTRKAPKNLLESIFG